MKRNQFWIDIRLTIIKRVKTNVEMTFKPIKLTTGDKSRSMKLPAYSLSSRRSFHNLQINFFPTSPTASQQNERRETHTELKHGPTKDPREKNKEHTTIALGRSPTKTTLLAHWRIHRQPINWTITPSYTQTHTWLHCNGLSNHCAAGTLYFPFNGRTWNHTTL